MTNVTFSVRVGDLELRSCDDALCGKTPHTSAEIVQWADFDGGPGCYTLAHWGGERDLRFVGARPLECGCRDTFWLLAERGQRLVALFEEGE